MDTICTTQKSRSLDNEAKTLSLQQGLKHVQKFDYSLKSFTLNSTEIEKFEIVIDAANKESAYLLQEAIANMCGYVLPIVTQRTDGKNAISICKDTDSNENISWNEFCFESV